MGPTSMLKGPALFGLITYGISYVRTLDFRP